MVRPLAPGASTSCTSTHTITQADIDAGSIHNVACLTGTQVCDDATVTAEKNPALTLVKTATPLTYSTVGQTISYSYLVTNTGNTTWPGPVTVTDDKATVTCPNVNTVGNLNAVLDPGEAITCTASYVITQADLNSGSVTNTATAHAGGTNSNPDTETVTAVQSPALNVVKSVTDPAARTLGR